MAQNPSYTETFVELIRRASTELPAEVVEALEAGREAETQGGLAELALGTIFNNVEMARTDSAPICQDTGTPVVWIHHPAGLSTRALKESQLSSLCMKWLTSRSPSRSLMGFWMSSLGGMGTSITPNCQPPAEFAARSGNAGVSTRRYRICRRRF